MMAGNLMLLGPVPGKEMRLWFCTAKCGHVVITQPSKAIINGQKSCANCYRDSVSVPAICKHCKTSTLREANSRSKGGKSVCWSCEQYIRRNGKHDCGCPVRYGDGHNKKAGIAMLCFCYEDGEEVTS